VKQAELGKESPVVVIGGPTASGKSALAIAVAEALRGTVINADAMQVYRELRVLTARPGPDDTALVPHRLYGVLSARQRCSVARWRSMALAAIAAAQRQGRLPVVVGGTGLYLKALIEGLAPVPAIDDEVRIAARARHAELGAAAFHAELAQIDPVMADRLKPGDTQRVLRAWEVAKATGRSLSLFQKLRPARTPFRFISVVLMPPRADLYAACDERCVRMLGQGALGEVRDLLGLGLPADLPALKALGVKELGAYLSGSISRDKALEDFQQATRNYAKRQVTWFRHQLPAARRFDAQFSESLTNEILSFIRNNIDQAESTQ
jgi:tRNA dimethylallyltransferase